MSEEDYKDGFTDGYKTGWAAAEAAFKKKDLEEKVKNHKFEKGCAVCGIGKNGEPFGYVCQHPECPTKVTVTNSIS